MSARDSTVLEARGLGFAYTPNQPALEDLSVAARGGLVHAVLGPNGAGKSTLLGLLLGHLRPTSGEVLLDGEPLGERDGLARARRIAYVPQRTRVEFAFSVREVIEMGRFHSPGESSEAVVEAAIADCSLEALADRRFDALSVGEAQRVLVARALAQSAPREHAPGVPGGALLLDEPVSAMDLRHVHATMETLGRVATERGLAVVVVLQDLDLAARYADAIWLLEGGRLRAEGPAREVLEEGLLSEVYGLPLRRLDARDLERRPRFEA